MNSLSKALFAMAGALVASLLAAADTAAATSGPGSGAGYPTKPIRFLVGVAPGGGTDFAARLIGQKLSEAWGQPVVVDNRTGATGLIAMGLLANSPPDGYTCIVFNIAHLMSAVLSRRAGFDPDKAFAPVSQIATGTVMLAVHPSMPGGGLADFVAHARANPGKLAYASGGQASIQHLSMELFAREARINLLHVPYKGTGPGMVDLVAGQVQASFTNILALHPHVKAGRLRALAVANPKRSALAEDVPTFVELGYGKVEISLWQGIMAPAGTPPAILEKLARAVAEAARAPDSVARLAGQGAEPAGTSPREFDGFLKSERARWQALARDLKISVE
jgi:tripartite-type tricarboxylate transporter receptor subunit TctC